jgi:sulfatase maturation enzyme AslB (radical SAM superfamily)
LPRWPLCVVDARQGYSGKGGTFGGRNVVDNAARLTVQLLYMVPELNQHSSFQMQPFVTDPEFSAHFRNLHQVFMYITDRCNLECEQCIYKPSISHFINEEIELRTALDLLCTFKKMGASKVTFLGGEPT